MKTDARSASHALLPFISSELFILEIAVPCHPRPVSDDQPDIHLAANWTTG
jgi:hypothetical protein